MPFVTEELWHQLSSKSEDLVISDWPKVIGHDDAILSSFNKCNKIVTNIRNIRKRQSIGAKIKLELSIQVSIKVIQNLPL